MRYRILKVKVSDHESDAFVAHSGIPHGSHQGPLIFLLYFNDVNHVLNGPRLTMISSCFTVSEHPPLHLFYNHTSTWCTQNRMVLNPAKCSAISFSRKKQTLFYVYRINNDVVSRVNRIKDLGVLLDSKLAFTDNRQSVTGHSDHMGPVDY